MADPPAPPQAPAPQWQDRLVNHFNTAEARFTLEDEAAKVPEAVQEFLKQMEMVEPPQRHAVFNRSARGSLLRTGLQWFQENQNNPLWQNFRTHLLESFVTADVGLAQQRELRSCQRMPGEAVLSYNRRFKEIADDAYPLPRNAEQTAILIQAYAKGLKDDRLREKIVTPNRPDNLQVAMQRVQALESKVENLAWIGVYHEPMEIDVVSATRPHEKTTSTPKPTYNQVEKDVHSLKTQYGKLESKLDRLLQGQQSFYQGQQRFHPGQRSFQQGQRPQRGQQTTTPQKEMRACYFCGIVGHLERDCRKKKKQEQGGSPSVAATHPKSA